MNLVQGILGHRQHPHVGSKLLNEGLNHCLTGGVTGDPDALSGDLLARVLEVESHDTVEQKVLWERKEERVRNAI